MIETKGWNWTATFAGMARGRYVLALRPERHTEPRAVILTDRALLHEEVASKAIEFWTEGACVPSTRLDMDELRALVGARVRWVR